MPKGRSINKYRVYCTTECKSVSLWNETTPSRCPNNIAHVIDPELTTIIDTVSDSNVSITSLSYEGSNGYYMMEGGDFEVVDAQPQSVLTYTYDTPSCIFGFNFTTTAEHTGDCLDIIINPDTVVGFLTAPQGAGDTTLHVSPTVIQNMVPGFYVTLDDGAHQERDLKIMGVDADAGTITVQRPLGVAFPGTTYVQLNLYIAKALYIGQPNKYKVGYGVMAGKPVPAGTTFRLVYHNHSGGAKRLRYFYEYTY